MFSHWLDGAFLVEWQLVWSFYGQASELLASLLVGVLKSRAQHDWIGASVFELMFHYLG